MKSPATCAGLLPCSKRSIRYLPLPVPVPVESMVDPLGDGLTNVLPEGLAVAALGLPIAPGLD
jgi:hypothetical protein